MRTFIMPSCTFSEATSVKSFDDDKDVEDDGNSLDIEAEQATLDVNFSPAAKDEDGDYEDDDKNSDNFEHDIEYTDKFHCQIMKLDDQAVAQQQFSNLSSHNADKCLDPTPRRTSHLSFGIDRILNQDDATPANRHGISEKKEAEANNVKLGLSCLDSISPTSTMSGHLVSCSPRKTSSPVSFSAPRIGSVDILPMTSGFHSPFLPAEACRTDSASLDLLPMRSIWPEVFVCPWTGMQRDRYGLVRRVGHPYQNRTPPKRKKPRTAFTRQQVLELEKRFTRQKYLASAERSALAKTLSMTDAQVKTWFQNRRTKWRRQTAEERDIERQAAHKFLLSLRTDEPARPVGYGTICGITQPASLTRTDDTSVPST